MPVSDRFTEFVVDQLEACGPITSRRMFGGVGIYAADLFFAILDNDVLYLKVDDSNRADFERVGSGPFRPYGDDSEVMQYYNVPVDVLEDATTLGRWAAKAIAVARAKKAGTSKPRVRAKKTRPVPAKKKRPRSLSSTKPAGSRKKPAGRRRK
jgi:DNA transformation protein and related proteins